MAMRKRNDEVVFPNTAGIDVGGSSHWVAVPTHLAEESVREFGAVTDDLNAMAKWLRNCGVETVALESTGVYWIPVYEVLEQHGLKVWLVDARQMKYVPGRKSDVQDCQWLQKLTGFGLLRGAFRPTDEVCVVRAVVRQREVLLTEQATWVQRMLKALVQMNIQLGEVLTDVMGMTGQAIIRDIVAGQRDPAQLAKHRNGRVKAKEEDIKRALTGNWRDARWAGVDLTRINGLAVSSVLTILSEVGPDLSRFANVKHFCSWLGLCPGTKISGGKVLSARTRRSTNPYVRH